MQTIHGIEAARLTSTVLAIGNFDGMHRGHQALLARGVEIARSTGGKLVAMTFEPHPAAILTPDRVPPTLTPLREKLRLLSAAGVDAAVVVPSTPAFFQASAEDFIRDIIIERFRPVAMVEGENFRFGAHRKGDVAMLREAGTVHGFSVQVVPPIRAALGGHPDTVISSSLIRHLIGSGNVDHAAMCLGRPYALLGTVRRGAGRGRTLGFPTANLDVADQLVPAEGVYAGRAAMWDEGAGAGDGARAAAGEERGKEGVAYAAAISIGRTPTFAGGELLIEAHLLDFDGDLYGRPMRFELLDWIRGQQRFESVDALRTQIIRDVGRVRQATKGLCG